MARLRFRLKSTPPARALSEPDRITLAFLREEGFSPVSTVRTDSDESNIRADLAAMFGNKAKDWPLLASYYLPAALPFQGVGQLNPASRTGKNA